MLGAPQVTDLLSVRAEPVEDSLLFIDRFFAKFRCRSIAAAGDSLSLASPKESKPRKGDPGVC